MPVLPASTSQKLECLSITQSMGSIKGCKVGVTGGAWRPLLTWKTCSSSSTSGSMWFQLSLGTEITFSTVPTSAGREK